MLTVEALNIYRPGQQEIGDYDVRVAVKDSCIWRGMVKGHVRSEGAAALLRRIADEMTQQRAKDEAKAPSER